MSCETIPEYHFCTVYGKTVWEKDFEVPEYDETFDLFMDIFNNKNLLIETVAFERFPDIVNKWKYPMHEETKRPAIYKVSIYYKKDEISRVLAKGTITVKSAI